jgi:hypothetical protein
MGPEPLSLLLWIQFFWVADMCAPQLVCVNKSSSTSAISWVPVFTCTLPSSDASLESLSEQSRRCWRLIHPSLGPCWLWRTDVCPFMEGAGKQSLKNSSSHFSKSRIWTLCTSNHMRPHGQATTWLPSFIVVGSCALQTDCWQIVNFRTSLLPPECFIQILFSTHQALL